MNSSHITITLQNPSPLPINFLKLTLTDSLAPLTRAILGEPGLSATEVYELEREVCLDSRRVLWWDEDEGGTRIEGGEKKVIKVGVLGKVGW